MHFLIVMVLIGGGSWMWLHASTPKSKLLAGACVALGLVASFGLAMFYRGLYRDQKK